jgi:nicotinate phosphoribosyltransferase
MIITSLLDTDLYKFTMMQAVLHQFPGAQVEYRFKCRTPGVDLASHASDIREEIRSLCSLHFQDSELSYLRSMRFIKSDFVDFLGLFKLNEKYITVTTKPNGEIEIVIIGPWLHTILSEPIRLAIVVFTPVSHSFTGVSLIAGIFSVLFERIVSNTPISALTGCGTAKVRTGADSPFLG